MEWNDVRHFLALARSGSVRSAGAALGVSHSTVARRVEALEEELGTRLFDRTRDGFALTDAGAEMLPGAERVEAEMAALERGAVGLDEALAGPVTLTCCDNYVSGILVPELAALSARCPDITLCFTTDSRKFDLNKREADVAIRTLVKGAQPPGYLIGRKVVPLVLCNYVARDHEARLDPELGATDTRFVQGDASGFTQVMIDNGSYPGTPAWGRFASLELMVQAASAGLGLVMLPTYVGDRCTTLRRLARPDLRHVADMWVLSHPDLRDNARIRAARDAVVAALSRHRALFSGDAPAGGGSAP